ncbi:hypothetical protein [Fructilactobacillus frigidiflavus]|uniref:hypothetical protein n=1 Tax=Fructilactobacillus frigidiflavus TaxID=3242688 RepID=UPI0037564EE1
MKIRVTIDTDVDKITPQLELLEKPKSLEEVRDFSDALVQAGILFFVKAFQDAGIAVPTKMLKGKYKKIVDMCLEGK